MVDLQTYVNNLLKLLPMEDLLKPSRSALTIPGVRMYHPGEENVSKDVIEPSRGISGPPPNWSEILPRPSDNFKRYTRAKTLSKSPKRLKASERRCPRCGLPGPHYVTDNLQIGFCDTPSGFWTCPDLYDETGRRKL